VRLRTFGGIAILGGSDAAGDQHLQRRQLAVLAVLAGAGPAGVTRDQLLGLIWPEQDTERARHALDQSLYLTRRAVGAEAVIAGPASLVLDAAVMPSDVAEFILALERRDLEAAVAVYAGPFLNGVYLANAPEFERWVEERRRHFADAFVRALTRLAAEASAKGDYAAAVENLRRAAASDPLSGAVAHALMLALAASGDRSAALEVGRAHAARMRDELEAVADTAVRSLTERLRAGGMSASSSGRTDDSEAGVPATAPAPPPPVGMGGRLEMAFLGRYRIVRELGAGSVATVFLAHDVKHDREVALKVLRPELAAALGTARFLNEVRISARLDHPHILTLIDSGEADRLLYYVLPFVPGESLRHRLRAEHPLGIDDALSIARQVASALDYAHRSGIVHRDVKPANILLREGDAVLTDFGIAVALREAGGGRTLDSGVSSGTPLYMSPEQATGEGAPDVRSDIYSLAAVLYEMLTGEPPHNGPTVQAVLAKLLSERPTPVRVLRPSVPASIEDAVTRGLATAPTDRFASVAEFALALETGAGDRPVSGPRASAAPGAWPRRRAVLAGLGATIVLGLGATAGLARFGGGRTPALPPNEVLQPPATPPVAGAEAASIGQLTVTVSGLPVDLPPTVLVTGPASYSKVIGGAGPVTLTHLPVGSYTVAASAVTSGTTAYLPDVARQTIMLRAGSPDGTVAAHYTLETFAIVFERSDGIIAMNADGSGQVVLTDHSGVFSVPIWSPDGSKIAFYSFPNGNTQIATMNFDGSAANALTNTPANQGDMMWSPNGSKIAFVSDRDGNMEIYVMNADGSRQVDLTNNPAQDFDPQWSPDGTKIAFVSNRSGHYQIHVMNADGTAQTDLSDDPASEEAGPKWSPDGRRIAFSSPRDGHDEIYVMNADGSGEINLTRNPAQSVYPEWSPDGTKISFLSDRAGAFNLFVMNADGTNPIQLTHAPYKVRAPDWSPDGKKLTYEQVAIMSCQRPPCVGKDSTGAIFTVNADGSGARQLTNAPLALDAYPKWRPKPRGGQARPDRRP